MTPAAVAGNGEGMQGKIDFVAYTADAVTRTYRTKIVLDNSQGLLRPGMIVRVRFVRQTLPAALTVPLYAVLTREGEKVVFIAEDGVARLQSVEIGPSLGERLVIRSGLEAGQQVIVKGQQLLTDGARIASGD